MLSKDYERDQLWDIVFDLARTDLFFQIWMIAWPHSASNFLSLLLKFQIKLQVCAVSATVASFGNNYTISVCKSHLGVLSVHSSKDDSEKIITISPKSSSQPSNLLAFYPTNLLSSQSTDLQTYRVTALLIYQLSTKDSV